MVLCKKQRGWFYEKTGFEKLGCPFNVNEIGEHQLMFHLF